MPQIKLTWEYDDGGPLPTVVEVFRDNAVIGTFNSPVTEYIDDVTAGTENVTYFVKSKYGELEAISDNVVVSPTAWSVFFPLTTDKYDIIHNGELYLKPNFGSHFNENSFTALGFNPQYSSGAYFNNAEQYAPLSLQYNEYTISFKIKAPPQSSYLGILEWSSPELSANVRCDYINNIIYMNHRGQEIVSTINVFDDIEHRIDIVRKDNTFFFYIDGVLDTSTPIESAQLTNIQATLTLGYRSGLSPFVGYIKDLGFSPLPLYG